MLERINIPVPTGPSSMKSSRTLVSQIKESTVNTFKMLLLKTSQETYL